jgi:hypothetical protein
MQRRIAPSSLCSIGHSREDRFLTRRDPKIAGRTLICVQEIVIYCEPIQITGCAELCPDSLNAREKLLHSLMELMSPDYSKPHLEKLREK